MLSKFAKLLLVATALAPILLTRAFIAVLKGQYVEAVIEIALAILLTLICMLILSGVRKEQQTLSVGTIKQLQAADTQIIGFVITYLLPLAKPQDTPDDIRVLLFVLFILGLAFWNSNAYHFNPLLGLLGYHFYEVTSCNDIKFVLITKRSLFDTKDISEVAKLTEYVVLDTKE